MSAKCHPSCGLSYWSSVKDECWSSSIRDMDKIARAVVSCHGCGYWSQTCTSNVSYSPPWYCRAF
jgi:hypothetical protein